MADENELTGKKIYVVTSVVQFNYDDVKKENVITRSFSTEDKAREYLYQHAKDVYWEHMEYPEEEFDDEEDEEEDQEDKEWDDTPNPDGYNRCFREVKKNNMYIMRTESYDGSFIQHNRALVKMDILLIDQGVYVKPTATKKPTAKKPTAKKPTAKKPTAKKPTAKKPTEKKPTTKKRKIQDSEAN